MNIQISRAGIEQLNLIVPLFNDYRVFYQCDSDLAKAESFLKARLTNEESVIFYALNDNGDCLGFTQLYPSFSSISAQSSLVLNDLYILPSARRLGIARLLMDAALSYARKSRVNGISLETADGNMAAQQLYKSLGYKKSEGFQHYFLSLD